MPWSGGTAPLLPIFGSIWRPEIYFYIDARARTHTHTQTHTHTHIRKAYRQWTFYFCFVEHLPQGCTNSGRQVALATKFYTLAPFTCACAVWNLAPPLWGQDFWGGSWGNFVHALFTLIFVSTLNARFCCNSHPCVDTRWAHCTMWTFADGLLCCCWCSCLLFQVRRQIDSENRVY
jgi:hypothetical protein